MPVDQFCTMVQQIGIERAYEQRHRGTGRTKRLALRTIASLSEGEKMHMYFGGKDMIKYCTAKDFIRQVRELAMNYMPDIEWIHRENSIECKTSGGIFTLIQDGADMRGHWQFDPTRVSTEIKDEY